MKQVVMVLVVAALVFAAGCTCACKDKAVCPVDGPVARAAE